MRSKRKVRKSPARKSALRLVFHDKKWRDAALTHPSYRNENPSLRYENFDRMEFFGDAVLNLAVCRKLYRLYPDADEGMLSRMRSILVSKKVLSKVGKSLKLSEHIRLGRGLKRQTNFSKSKIISDCFEALVAALYFDQGYERAERFILKHLKPYFDSKKLFRLDPNPKSTLQEMALKKWKRLPVYTNKTTDRGTKTNVVVNTRLRTTARAKTRRESEEKAARQLIQKIRQRRPASRRPKKDSSGKKLRRIL